MACGEEKTARLLDDWRRRHPGISFQRRRRWHRVPDWVVVMTILLFRRKADKTEKLCTLRWSRDRGQTKMKLEQ